MEQKELVLKIAAAIAWADGGPSAAERKHLASLYSRIGDFSDEEIEDSLATSVAIESLLDEIEKLPINVLSDVLVACYDVAASDNGVVEREAEAIMKIARRAFPAGKAEKVLPWLEHAHQAGRLGREIFMEADHAAGLPHAS